MLHRSRYLHLQLLVHVPSQLIAEEDHHEGACSQEKAEHEQVEDPAHDCHDCGRF